MTKTSPKNPIRVGVILSGCGRLDGSEIKESVLTLLALDQQGAQAIVFAPDLPQTEVKNHLTGQKTSETRNMLVEASRLVHEAVLPLSQASVKELDALILPGGYGAAQNLSNFAVKGKDATVLPELKQLLTDFRDAKKPVGFICIAPHLIPLIYPKGVHLTVGRDEATSDTLRAMGGEPIFCDARDIVVDPIHKVVSTPAYMIGKRIGDVAAGISQLVSALLTMATGD